jgi:hypothetical protein
VSHPIPSSKTAVNGSSGSFAVDGHLLRLVSRAGIPLRNPNLLSPLVRRDGEGAFLEMRVESSGDGELGLVRRIAVESLSPEALTTLPIALEQMNWSACVNKGLSQGLAGVQERSQRRWLTSLMTFLNPRQLAILLYCYQQATSASAQVTVNSDDLLMALGYTRTKDGGFASKVRSQVHQDLVALHRVELVYPRAIMLGKTGGESASRKVEVRSLLKIVDFVPERSASGFDLFRAADMSFEMAERYTVDLNCRRDGATSRILFPKTVDLSQRLGGNAKNDYRMRLLIYLASRVAWGLLSDGQYMILSKQGLFNNLDLLGSNSSRNNQIFWRTIEGLKQEKFIMSAQELPGKSKMNSVQFQVNPELWGTV